MARGYHHIRAALLASSAFVAIAAAPPALANCDVAASPNSVVCSANTTTTDTTNTDAATASSADRGQIFSTGANVSGSIGTGVTVGGYGLGIETTESGAGVSFTNNGALNQATSILGGSGSLQLTTSDGAITYNSASGASISGVATAALMLFSRSSSATGDITAHINGDVSNVGSYAAAIGVALQSSSTTGINYLLDGTGNISGHTGISVNAANANSGTGDINIGGSGNITFTDSAGSGIEIRKGTSAGTVTVDRTGTITGTGGGIGINVRSNGTGGVFVTGVGAISGVTNGIYGTGTDSFNFTPGGAISASNSGIYAQVTSGSSTVDITSAYNITSTGSGGIGTSSVDGNAAVTVTGERFPAIVMV